MRLRKSRLSFEKLDERLVPAIINFALNPATSSLTLSGTISGLFNITSQGTGSLTSKYSGSLTADVDFANNTIAFLGIDNAADANPSGTWQPAPGGVAGSAPADYGGQVVAFGALIAIRDAKGRVDSSPLNLTGGGASKTFSSTQTFTLTDGVADYTTTSLGNGVTPLAGNQGTNAAAAGTFTDSGNGNYSLTVPIDVTINTTVSGFATVLKIKGTLNGSAVLPVVDLNGPGTGSNTTFNFAAGSPPTNIAPAATITRSPAANLTSMTVTLATAPDGLAEVLAADTSGTVLINNGFNSGTGELTITGTGTLADYQSVLQKVTYDNTNGSPTVGDRTITVTVSDGTNSSLVRIATGTVTAPAVAQVQSIAVNDGTDQRSLVTSLSVTFDSKISPEPTVAAFQLVRSDLANVNLSLVVDNSGPTTKAVLSFTGGAVNGTSLADGRYNLTINGALINGGNFDGGGGTGSNYQLIGDPTTGPKLYRLFGDADGNNVVNATDFNAFRLVYGAPGMSIFDFDNSGSVTAADFNEFRLRYGASV